MSENPDKRPAPFVPDEADAPKDPQTGRIKIDEPDVTEPAGDEDTESDEDPAKA